MERKIRISILDGFRAISILSVILYHYFSRWTPPNSNVNLYPYGNKYAYLFNYGHVGVHFFFVISGFVIFFTLERTDNLIVFWKKRMIRLLPSIIMASLFTIIFFRIFDDSNLFPDSHSLKNLIPSLTFINPNLLNHVFNCQLSYINGSYWSLWPEIQFYMLASILYFLNKKRFLINFMLASIAIILFNYIIINLEVSSNLHTILSAAFYNNYFIWVSNGFNLVTYLPFFCLGVLFCKILSNRKEQSKQSYFIKACFFIIAFYIIYTGKILPVRVIYLSIITVFLVFIYYPNKLFILEKPPITDIGESSYFLYLIHENIGIYLIFTLGKFILPGSFLMPLILIIAFSYLSILFLKKVDQPINNWLKYKIIKS